MILVAESQQGGEIAIPLGGGRHAFGVRRSGGYTHPFPGKEPEDPVPAIEEPGQNQRPPGRQTVLIENRHGFLLAGFINEERSRLEAGGLVELVKRSVKAIGAALGDLVRDAATGVPVRCVGLKNPHLHFLNRVHGRIVGDTQAVTAVRRAV